MKVDLNADLGEHPGTNLDETIMPYLSSCNIACGGHIGDEASIRATMLLAQQNNVAIGAHPSFPDKEHFGRKEIRIPEKELRTAINQQIQLACSVAEALKVKLNHVKPHGALYNLAAKDEATSRLIGEEILYIDPALKWMGLAHSSSAKVAAKMNITFIAEAFADRRYQHDRTLKPRSEEGAVIASEENVLQQVDEIVMRQRVYSSGWVSLEAQSICLHGDTLGAVNLAQKIRNHLANQGVQITAI